MPGIHHQHVERPAVAHPRDHRVAVGAVGPHRRAARLRRQPLRRLARSGIGEGHRRALRREAPHDRRPDPPAAAEHQNGLSLKRGHRALLEFNVVSRYINPRPHPSRHFVMMTTNILRARAAAPRALRSRCRGRHRPAPLPCARLRCRQRRGRHRGARHQPAELLRGLRQQGRPLRPRAGALRRCGGHSAGRPPATPTAPWPRPSPRCSRRPPAATPPAPPTPPTRAPPAPPPAAS